MRRLPFVVTLAACGRVGFGAHDLVGGDAAAVDAPAAPLTLPGLRARYPMDDDPALGAVASAELPATCSGTCPTAIVGRFAGGYHFSGGELIDLPSTTLVGATPFTIAVWARLDAYPIGSAGAPMVAKPSDAGQTDAASLLLFDMHAAFETTPDGSATDYDSATVLQPLGGWHHLAASWDGTTKRLYQDGAGVGTEVAPFLDSSQVVSIGVDRDAGVPAFYFAGTLDELQFYGRALSDAEILSLAQ
jgi:hypothetical protein